MVKSPSATFWVTLHSFWIGLVTLREAFTVSSTDTMMAARDIRLQMVNVLAF